MSCTASRQVEKAFDLAVCHSADMEGAIASSSIQVKRHRQVSIRDTSPVTPVTNDYKLHTIIQIL